MPCEFGDEEENLSSMAKKHDPNILPEDFVPSELDIICGWARQNYNHAGNRRLRDIIASNVEKYIAAKTKRDKGQVIVEILDKIRNESPTGVGMARLNPKTGRWSYIGNEKAKDKIGHALRKASQEYAKHGGMKKKGIKPDRKPVPPRQPPLTSTSATMTRIGPPQPMVDGSMAMPPPHGHDTSLAFATSVRQDPHAPMVPSANTALGGPPLPFPPQAHGWADMNWPDTMNPAASDLSFPISPPPPPPPPPVYGYQTSRPFPYMDPSFGSIGGLSPQRRNPPPPPTQGRNYDASDLPNTTPLAPSALGTPMYNGSAQHIYSPGSNANGGVHLPASSPIRSNRGPSSSPMHPRPPLQPHFPHQQLHSHGPTSPPPRLAPRQYPGGGYPIPYYGYPTNQFLSNQPSDQPQRGHAEADHPSAPPKPNGEP